MAAEIAVTEVTMAPVKPRYEATAEKMLDAALAFFADPENERAYQEWRENNERK